jgi:peptidoglycan/LPS O-acetylase OafA/YrhL
MTILRSIVLICFILVNRFVHSLHPPVIPPIPVNILGECTTDLERLLLNTSLVPNGNKILSAWGLGQGDLGSYSICATYEKLKYHYCWMGTDITRAIGLCVPSSCTASVILQNINIIVAVVEHLQYNSSLDIFETGCTQIDPIDTGAIITISITSTLLLLLLVSSIASWRKRCFDCMERGCDCVSVGNRTQLDNWNWGGWSLQNSAPYDSVGSTDVGGTDVGGGFAFSSNNASNNRGEIKCGSNQQNSDSEGNTISNRRSNITNGTTFSRQSRRPSRPTVPPHMVGAGSEFVAAKRGPNQSDSDVEETKNSFTSRPLDVPLLSPAASRGDVEDGIHNSRQSTHSYSNEETSDSCLLKVSSIIINSFSLKATYRQLCAKDRRPLAPLHALRVLATLWVILGNIVVYMMPVIRNLAAVEDEITHAWTAQVVVGAVLANDVFLVLGGFFAGHSFLVRLKAVNRKSAFSSISNLRYGCIDVPRMYASRLVRILPTYGVVLGWLITISGKLNPGPLHSVFQENAVEPCKKLWWSNILLINNIYPMTDVNDSSDWYSAKVCMSWTWYLAVDFQLYLVSPIFVMIFWRFRKAGWYILCLTLFCAIGVQIWLGMHFHYSMNPFHYSDTKDEYHTVASIKPYTRCVPYLLGLGAAMIFHNEAGRLKRGGNRGGSRGDEKSRRHLSSLEGTPNASGSEESSPQRSRNHSSHHHSNVDLSGIGSGDNGAGRKSQRGSSSSSLRYRDVLESSNCVLFGFVAAVATILLVVFLPATDYLGADNNHGGTSPDVHGGHGGGSRGGSIGCGGSNVTKNDFHATYINCSKYNSNNQYRTVISNWSDLGSVAYAVFSHVAMGLSITFIVLAFSLGHGGWLREMTKAQWWHPLSRLTYGVYLVHPMLIFFSYTASLDLIYFQPLTVVINFISLTILSFFISFLLFLLITLPFRRIGRGMIWGIQIGHGKRLRGGQG